jgi:tetratricopeptide (TPR) repeat protein
LLVKRANHRQGGIRLALIGKALASRAEAFGFEEKLSTPKEDGVNMNLRTGRIFIVAALIAMPFIGQATAQSRDPRAVEQVKTAIELKKKGDSIAAEGHYREALRLDPNYAEAHFSYAILLADRGDTNAAISEYKRAIEIQKSYPEAHFNLALMLRKKGDMSGEIKEYEKAIASAPNYTIAHFNLANALVERGDYDGAIQHYQEYLRLAPTAKDAEQVRQEIKKLQGR